MQPRHATSLFTLALITVGFDETHYWIDYKDSIELDYQKEDLVKRHSRTNRRVIKGPIIHDRYNLWVKNVSDRIRQNVAALTAD